MEAAFQIINKELTVREFSILPKKADALFEGYDSAIKKIYENNSLILPKKYLRARLFLQIKFEDINNLPDRVRVFCFVPLKNDEDFSKIRSTALQIEIEPEKYKKLLMLEIPLRCLIDEEDSCGWHGADFVNLIGVDFDLNKKKQKEIRFDCKVFFDKQWDKNFKPVTKLISWMP